MELGLFRLAHILVSCTYSVLDIAYILPESAFSSVLYSMQHVEIEREGPIECA